MQEQQAFIHQLNQHQRIIHKVCNVYMDNASDREDLFQEITLQAWKSYQKFRGDSLFSTWLYRVALNTAITYFKKEKKNKNKVSEEWIPEKADEEHFEAEQMQAMYKAIEDLSKIDKAIVMLYLDDYPYQEIGSVLGISANNVAVKMNRIKLKLKESAQKYYQTP